MSESLIDLLLVEDDDAFRETAARWMIRKGHRVQEASTGSEAVRLLERKRLDVAVVDMNMAGMPGMEVLQRMQEFGDALVDLQFLDRMFQEAGMVGGVSRVLKSLRQATHDPRSIR
jgi:CheY-like chemotaxis protein